MLSISLRIVYFKFTEKIVFFQVRPLSEIDNFVRVCRLKLDYLENGRVMSTMIRHFQWENWPDRGVPPTRLTATVFANSYEGFC